MFLDWAVHIYDPRVCPAVVTIRQKKWKCQQWPWANQTFALVASRPGSTYQEQDRILDSSSSSSID